MTPMPLCRAAFVFTLFAVLAMSGAALSAAADDRRDRLIAALDLSTTDPDAGFAALKALADTGYARALERLGAFHLRGTGTPRDADAAIDAYRQAVAAGYDRALVPLGRALARAGRADAALDALTRAVDADVPGAALALANAHATSALGALSRPGAGWNDLVALAGTGDTRAQITLLQAALRIGRDVPDRAAVLARLTVHADAGNGRAAETLLAYYRRTGRSPRAHLPERLRLLDHPGLRARIRAEEQLHIAAANQARQFWRVSSKIVQAQSGPAFERALVVTAQLNKNAYVFALQRELPPLGYPAGRVSGVLTRPTLNAILRFCRDRGIAPTCRQGPLKSVAVKAIAAELAILRR